MIQNRQVQLEEDARTAKEFINSRGGVVKAYSDVSEAGDFSLQKISYAEDEVYFAYIISLMGIITSIVSKPHISTKREEIFKRIEQAGNISADDFARVCRDGRLWKRHGSKMIPEELYYYQHEDELAIYENKFIVFLVNLIGKEISQLKKVYGERLPVVADFTSVLDAGKAGLALEKTAEIDRRISYLKYTDFFKIVGREKPIKGKVTPTNILLKDPKYRACFKFYNTFLKYQTEAEGIEAILAVTKILLFKALAAEGYSIQDNSTEELFTVCNGCFTLTFKFETVGSVVLNVLNKKSGLSAKYVLFVGNEINVEDREVLEKSYGKDVVSFEHMSIWSLKDAFTGEEISSSGATEEQLVSLWVTSKMRLVKSASSAYKKYCPVCGNSGVYEKEKFLHCSKCGSRYAFTLDESGCDAIWLCKVRRGI